MTSYYPDSSFATDWTYVPCTNAKYSASCIQEGVEHDICLPNGLCWFPAPDNHESYIYRGACTDPSWTRPECSTYCTVDIGNTWESLRWCNVTQKFCCARAAKGKNDTDCCNYLEYRFSLPNLPSWVVPTLIGETDQRPSNSSVPGEARDPTGSGSSNSTGSSIAPSSPASNSHGRNNTALIAGLSALGAVVFILIVFIAALALCCCLPCGRRILFRGRRPANKGPTSLDSEPQASHGPHVTTLNDVRNSTVELSPHPDVQEVGENALSQGRHSVAPVPNSHPSPNLELEGRDRQMSIATTNVLSPLLSDGLILQLQDSSSTDNRRESRVSGEVLPELPAPSATAANSSL